MDKKSVKMENTIVANFALKIMSLFQKRDCACRCLGHILHMQPSCGIPGRIQATRTTKLYRSLNVVSKENLPLKQAYCLQTKLHIFAYDVK